tara:strand:- start:431 stop:682 length:252 start_codon:yes stop_codon:yes gene_type:complete
VEKNYTANTEKDLLNVGNVVGLPCVFTRCKNIFVDCVMEVICVFAEKKQEGVRSVGEEIYVNTVYQNHVVRTVKVVLFASTKK